MKNYKILNILTIFIISLVIFFFFLGFNYSNPINSNWLRTGDLISYQDGWNFFKKDIWRFPIGSLPTYGVDAGNSIVYADIIPLFAIIFKLFRSITSDNFQYFSLWIFLSIFLQSLFSYLIIFKITKNFLYSIIGSIFFSISPLFFQRLGIHIALASHWLILLSFYIETFKEKKNMYRNLNILLSITIHFSLTIVIFIFHYLFKFKELFQTKKISFLLLDSFILGFCSIFIMFILGYFEIPPEDGLGGGYGYFSFNLNSFFNPINVNGESWSLFLPILKYNSGQYEGFAYLGLSGILFFIIFLISFFYKKNFLYEKKMIIIITLVFFVLAISNNIYFGEKLIVNIEINKYIYGILGIVRTSGRLIWPIYYLIFLTGIIYIYKRFPKNVSITILSLLLVVQVIDLSPGYIKYFKGKIYKEGNKLIDPIWNEIPKYYNYVRIIEKTNTSNLYYKIPNYLGKNKFKKTDIFNAARVDRVKLEESSYMNILQLSKGLIEKNEVYFINNKQHLLYLKLILKNNPNYHFYLRDEIWILMKKKIIDKNLLELKILNDLEAKLLPYNEKKNLKYNLDDGYHSIGWKKTDNGIVTRGYLSTLMFSLEENSCKETTSLNIQFDDKYIKYLNNNIKANIIVNKIYIKQINFNELDSDIFNVKIPCNKEDINYLIEFGILNSLSLRETKKDLNPQKLGFEILNIELLN
tara:strand:- start:646 stop:2733 length:2088 start_codon:yes stop_codon:yes gene_type:complete